MKTILEEISAWFIRISIAMIAFLAVRLVNDIDNVSNRVESLQIDVAVIKNELKLKNANHEDTIIVTYPRAVILTGTE